MTQRRTVDCLDDELSEYAAGRLDDLRTRAWDLHLVACRVCGHAVAEERRLREALAGGPSMPGDLRLTLLALGRELDHVPAVSRASAREPLALLAPTAPACHRSALRATVVAAAAAGASAAAAWSLTVMGGPGVARQAVVTGPTSPAVAPVGSTSPRPTGPVITTVGFGRSATPRPVQSGRQAESGP
ncbi:hypothetical protein JQN72_12880 [Phycicoccus sp. CSK15P-2]|uniref:hypothetical protein n=1 Tax=Phycicoccus sp. CSK15P-2 TaxID=2807627 RepID=UPI0019515045|nr:hypothetical protein [Phycicoccus sp. CSK15P-2]MBM6405136.1 hypothetical protein [Phycicoccus sp. CSK15P-2]